MMKRSISTSTRLDSQFMPPNLTGRSSSHLGASAAWAELANARNTAAAARVLTGLKRIGFSLHRFRDTTAAKDAAYAVELRGLCGRRAEPPIQTDTSSKTRGRWQIGRSTSLNSSHY